MDNRQNTVSCVEREIRQHIGIGWQYTRSSFRFAVGAYAGFYYIEIDDDTPVARGYNRFELDDGEASNAFAIEASYIFSKKVTLHADMKHFAANAGMETLEDNYNLLLTFRTFDSFLTDNATLNFKIKHTKYNFDRFNTNHQYTILPWNNDTLIQAYIELPLKF